MPGRFEAFVIFAEMRTGSNFLEESLNTLPGLKSYGEVFNPGFLGHHRQFDLLGMDLAARDADPVELLRRMVNQTQGLSGFRLFHDHDPRIVDHVLAEPTIAKVILTRDPVARYVSWKIVQKTGQWRLTDLKHRKDAKVHFDTAEYKQKEEELSAFRARVRRRLQETGQSAFSIDYADLADVGVLNGLAHFLGTSDRLAAPSSNLKKQNPAPIETLVDNPSALTDVQSSRYTTVDQTFYEPMPGAAVPRYVAHPGAALLFQPTPGGPVEDVIAWMAQIDGVGRDGLVEGMTQKTLRDWMKNMPGFRSFTVLRHPLMRAVEVFNRYLLPPDHDGYGKTRDMLRQRYKVPLPPLGPGPGFALEEYRAALMAFLAVLKGFLDGQTNLRPHPNFTSQSAHLQSMAQVVMPHHLFRETDLVADSKCLAKSLALVKPQPFQSHFTESPFSLQAVYSSKMEKAAFSAYRRDYIDFGFGPWATP